MIMSNNKGSNKVVGKPAVKNEVIAQAPEVITPVVALTAKFLNRKKAKLERKQVSLGATLSGMQAREAVKK
jgi:hypothetical protein